MSGRRRLRWVGIAVAFMTTPVFVGCIELDLEADVRTTGAIAGTAKVQVPGRLRHDPRLGAMVTGSEGSIVETWRARGVKLDPLDPQTQKDRYRLFAQSVTDLRLPWFSPQWQPHDGNGFAYRHTIEFPADAFMVLRQSISRTLRPLAGRAHQDPEKLAKGFVRSASFEWVLRFPGSVTATNGERVDERTVRWRYGAEEIERGEPLHAYAYGKRAWWRGVMDPVNDRWDAWRATP